MSDEKTCRNCVMYQDGYCNRDGINADKTKPSYSCRWWIKVTEEICQGANKKLCHDQLERVHGAADDNVNHPSYYTYGQIEVSDFIADKNLNFFRGNVVKYVTRAGKKDPSKEVEDLKKAQWYINREIERVEGKA